MNKLKKTLIAAAVAGSVVIGAKSCHTNIAQIRMERPDYLKSELEKEIIEHKRADLLEDLVRFSHNAKKAFDSNYTTPQGFSREPYDLWIETEKNERGEVVAYLVNHRTGNRYAILEDDVVKSKKADLNNKLGKTFRWVYEAINGL